MNKEEFKEKILQLEEEFLNLKGNRSKVVRKILNLLEEEWANENIENQND